ncbi:endonuclease domain-containing protein [Actinomyces ruminicola]|uniref:endonuclease domain-containing protein n=1 Tax=Actinomyces ruminicola TaxID=332524 RepID=UPI0021C2B44F|nr:endonuclease domain-containing protein [Actinomyces ruminicola]
MGRNDDILARVRACHGAVRIRDLHPDRTERRHIERLIEARRLIAHPHGVVSLPGVGWDLVLARIHGGLITCMHAAKHYGYPYPRLWTPVHLAVPRGRLLPALKGEVLHVEGSLQPLPPTRFPVAPVPLMLARYLRCSPDREAPLMACDAALHEGHADVDAVAALLRGPGSRQARQWLALASSRARSPLETLARLQLHDAGIPFEDGVDIPGVGEVDLLVDGRLVLELDGYTYHEDDFQFARDRRRDRELVRQGYRVARFTRKDVQLGKVGAEIRGLLAARDGLLARPSGEGKLDATVKNDDKRVHRRRYCF